MSALEALRTARELLSVPERWTKKKFARNRIGFEVDPKDPTACCWCMSGALSRSTLYVDNFLATDYLEGAIENFTSGICKEVTYFNDHPETTHAQVMSIFDTAIKCAEVGEVLTISPSFRHE